jgi:hypothetical protein
MDADDEDLEELEEEPEDFSDDDGGVLPDVDDDAKQGDVVDAAVDYRFLQSLGVMVAAEGHASAFMVIDVVIQRSKTSNQTEAVLFGRERRGGSVCLTVRGWQPYLLIAAPKGWEDTPWNCSMVQMLLETRVRTHLEQNSEEYFFKPKKTEPAKIFRVSTMHDYKSIFGYVENASAFLKIEVAYPRIVTALHDIFVGVLLAFCHIS